MSDVPPPSEGAGAGGPAAAAPPAEPETSSAPAMPPPPPTVAPSPPVPALRAGSRYPINLDVEVPAQIARWRPLVQWLLAIPLFIVLYVLRIVALVLAFLGWFAALFTGQFPETFGSFIAGYYRYAWRAFSYSWFLRETYPPFGPSLGYEDPGGDPAWFEVRRGEGLSRLFVLFRIILVIPQAIMVLLLSIALYVAMVVAFFAVIITGGWPSGLREFVVGASRWILRVDAWFYLLADPYPPFSLT
jgi:Domain of unknown function (DUF4389)